jgi:polysaccharide biosynthesis PFTS motif protein
MRQFLEDASQSLALAGLIMLYKRKRPLIRLAGTAYRRKVEQISAQPHVVLVDPRMSARRVVERAAAVISIPYTSTALIGAELGKPSVFYDPTGTLPDDPSLSHGLPLIRSRAELARWLRSLEPVALAESIPAPRRGQRF